MIDDPIFLGVIVCGGSAVILAYCFGHFRGVEAAFDVMHRAHGDVPHVPSIPVHTDGVNRE